MTGERTEGPEPGARRPPVPQTPAHALDAAAVAATYGLGEVRAPLRFAARGELGRIWRLDTSTGLWAVKELLAEQTEEAAARDVAFQEHALGNGVAMPRPRRTRDGRVIAEIPASDGELRRVRVYAWVDLAPEPPAASAVQAADQLGRLHSGPFPDDGPVDPWFGEPVEDDCWSEVLEAGRSAGAAWADALQAAFPELVRANALVAVGHAVQERVRCHLDYNPMNVLLDRAGRPVVVDWENSGPAGVDQELASAIAEFVPDAADVPRFLEAYLAAGGVAVPLDVGAFTLTLAVQGHLVGWYARRSLDTAATEESRLRAGFWVQDICAHLFTVDQVEAWVSASQPYLG